jgi:predicted cupin superfamily sugar epimerase
MRLTANAVQKILDLKPHPTCGLVRESFRSTMFIPTAQLPTPFFGSRALGSVLYFMVTEQTQIVLHRILSDQMYHHYLGDPLDVLLLYPNGDGCIRTLGPYLDEGMRPQLLIPGCTFHVSRLRSPKTPAERTGYALLGTSEWPAADHSDVEIGVPEKLMETYPHLRDQIARFTGWMPSASAAA